MNNFKDIITNEKVLRAIEDMGFTSPTDVQRQVMLPILSGKDVIVRSPTGSGKTCAFAMPILEKLDGSDNLQALILCPTRELAMQICEEFKRLLKYSEGARVAVVYGGQPIMRQITALKKKPQIVVGTCGRVMDHIERRTVKLDDLSMLVLDEVDEMLDMGFRPDIDKILSKAKADKQTLLFSATLPAEIKKISKAYQKDAVLIETTKEEREIPDIEMQYIVSKDSEKINVLCSILDELKPKSSLVFCRTKRRASELANNLQARAYNALALHGDLKQKERDFVMSSFRNKAVEIMVATDVAARGIDVADIDVVFNFDLPGDVEYFIHRIGRTARANKKGVAISLITASQKSEIREYQKFLNKNIEEIMLKDEKDVGMTTNEKRIRAGLSKMTAEKNELTDLAERLLLEYNVKNGTDFKPMDLLVGVLKAKEERVMSEAAKVEKKEFVKARDYETTRFFITLGNMDNIDEKGLVKFLSDNSSITSADVAAVKIMETFSFAEINKALESEVLKISGKEYKMRKVAVEVASPSTGGRGKGGESKGRSNAKNGAPRKDYGDRKPYAKEESKRSDRKPATAKTDKQDGKKFGAKKESYGAKKGGKSFSKDGKGSRGGDAKKYYAAGGFSSSPFKKKKSN